MGDEASGQNCPAGGKKIASGVDNGDGTFAAGIDYATGVFPKAITLGDVDGDGDLDALSVNAGLYNAHADDDMSVFLNHGDGTFAQRVDYTVGDRPTDVVLGDMDGDGDLDAVVVNQSGTGDNKDPSISVLLAYDELRAVCEDGSSAVLLSGN